MANPLTSEETKNPTNKETIKSKHKNLVILAREMEKTLGTEKAHKIVKDAFFNDMYQSVTEEMKELGPVECFADFVRIEKDDNETPGITSNVNISYVNETDTELGLQVTKCLDAEVFKELESVDLGYLIVCNPDHAYATACNPRVKLRRSKTLMQGDPYCNHTWYWE